ncbi:hypothetical protein HFO56_03215 [Rhizobium laguerreae]|uniref:hypothetical protein n=1 Tax=Rhizobium laguerreae TaxID=1076926 RepID=UPI001C90DC95|nr:hypothetical protein [Rhizobium laguerreae]MBY3151397.1 hypothetical protein [Rhizobium laguerreae]
MFYFDTKDRHTGQLLTESAETIADIKRRLRSNDVRHMLFCGNDRRTHMLDQSFPDEKLVTLWTTTTTGNERRERWSFAKFESYLDGGLIGLSYGDLHNRWIEEAKPKPLSPEMVAFCQARTPPWLTDLMEGRRPINPPDWLQPPPEKSKSVDAQSPDWKLHAQADGDFTVQIWRVVCDDGSELFQSSKDGNPPEDGWGFKKLDKLLGLYPECEFTFVSQAEPAPPPRAP